jgi:hypothetical protein
MENFETNLHIYSINTRHKHDFHVPDTNFIVYWKGVYYAVTKVYNALSSNTAILNSDIKV